MKNRKKDVTDRLYEALSIWLESKGGRLAVAGGIEIQQWDISPYKFTVGIKCMGKKPKCEGK